MQILEGLFQPHLGNVERALGLATKRQSLLMANLANVNTPGYRRRDLDFNIALDRAAGLSGRSQEGARAESGAIRIDGNGVDLEREVAAIAETELRYQLLTEFAGRYFGGLKNVIREGR